MSDEIINVIEGTEEVIEEAVKIISRWFDSYPHLKGQGKCQSDPPWMDQGTFAGFIYDNWEESYNKKMQEPNIRQDVEDQIKIYKSWKERGI